MAKQYSTVRAEHIEYSLWLIFDATGSARMCRGEPYCARGERAVSLSVTLPKSLFHVPQLKVSLTVPDGATQIPPIDIVAAADALKATFGVDFDVSVMETKNA